MVSKKQISMGYGGAPKTFDSLSVNIILYEDGTFLYNFFPFGNGANLSIPEFLEKEPV